jgi:hypothetical protein
MTTARLSRARVMLPLVAAVLATKALSLAEAQQPTAQPPPIAAYRPPVIALVQPPGGGVVPQDRPVLVFRFAAGEPGDPLDAASLRVLVDGVDQTPRFQVSSVEAWGSIADSILEDDGAPLGPRQVVARICSLRGACTESANVVTVVPPLGATGGQTRSRPDGRKERLLDALLAAARKLLNP